MTEHSQNGWSAAPTMPTRRFFAPGVHGPVEFLGGIRDDDDVETVMQYVVDQIALRVERPINPGCWGGNYRPNRNDPNSLSNHASRTAVDYNAPRHPNGVPTTRTFNAAQIAEIHQILSEVSFVIRWGGDYSGTPDSMHMEVNVSAARLHVAAEALRAKKVTPRRTPLPRKVRLWLGSKANVRRLKKAIRKGDLA